MAARALGSGAGGGGPELGRGEARAKVRRVEAGRLQLSCAPPTVLHSLHVEHVIAVHLFLGGLRALGHRDGVAHCRDRGHRDGTAHCRDRGTQVRA